MESMRYPSFDRNVCLQFKFVLPSSFSLVVARCPVVVCMIPIYIMCVASSLWQSSRPISV